MQGQNHEMATHQVDWFQRTPRTDEMPQSARCCGIYLNSGLAAGDALFFLSMSEEVSFEVR